MDSDSVKEKLKQLDIEDFIWLVYIGIIFFSWYSNSLERKYFFTNNLFCKEKYRKIMILIFSILLIVYMYFLKSSVDDIRKLNSFDSPNKRKLVYMSFVASLLIAFSGFIFLYIAFVDENLDVELAFN